MDKKIQQLDAEIPQDVQKLLSDLMSPSPFIRSTAVEKLGNRGCKHEEVISLLKNTSENDTDQNVKNYAQIALKRLEDKLPPSRTAGTSNAKSVPILKQANQGGQSAMIIGGILFAIGFLLTFLTYSSASSGGGTYIIAWGPMLTGAIIFIRGLINN